MIDLDDLATYENLDPSGLHRRIHALPEQCRRAWLQAQKAVIPGIPGQYGEIIIAGMGGSAIAGDLVADLAGPDSKIQVRVVRDFRIPGLLADQNSPSGQLVIVCSFSGETEETLSIFAQVQSAKVPTIAITGGGTLGRQASQAGVPVINIDAPGEPRSAVGYNLMILISLLARIGAIKVSDFHISTGLAAAEHMVSRVGIDIPTGQNQAKLLASELVGGLTVVYGGGSLCGMGLRWKSQINENGKSWAFAESLPELLHNSVESFPGNSMVSERTTALLLKPIHLGPELDRRYVALEQTLMRCGIKSHTITAVTSGILPQSMELMVLGDHISYYMGILNGSDPCKTPNIDFSKESVSS